MEKALPLITTSKAKAKQCKQKHVQRKFESGKMNRAGEWEKPYVFVSRVVAFVVLTSPLRRR